MSKPRLLDLFCGAGGAAMGYHRAGFEVVGVDIKPQPHYPFEFVQADVTRMFGEASDYLLHDPTFRGFPDWETPYRAVGFDAIHASPPCQAFTSMRSNGNVRPCPNLLTPTRKLLEATGLPWIIENVPGAPMRPDLVLCGSSFGLPLKRHRWFEMSTGILWLAPPCIHRALPEDVEIYDHGKRYKGRFVPVFGHGGGKHAARWKEAMGIDWMTREELSQAIPPAYTEWIGRQLIAHLEESA